MLENKIRKISWEQRCETYNQTQIFLKLFSCLTCTIYWFWNCSLFYQNILQMQLSHSQLNSKQTLTYMLERLLVFSFSHSLLKSFQTSTFSAIVICSNMNALHLYFIHGSISVCSFGFYSNVTYTKFSSKFWIQDK